MNVEDGLEKLAVTGFAGEPQITGAVTLLRLLHSAINLAPTWSKVFGPVRRSVTHLR